MTKSLMKAFIIITILLFSVTSYSAEAVKLRYITSIYYDSKGGGLKFPEGIACNEKSLIIVADTGNGRLLQYTFQDGAVKGGEDIKVPELSYPLRIQINSKGEIFALDGKQRRIVRLSPEGVFKGYIDPEGLPAPATFIPRSFKVDNAGNIYILDIFSARVLVLDSAGKYLRHIEFPENYGFPLDLAIDSKGNIFLLDSVNAMVFSAAKDSRGFSALTKSMKGYINFPTYMALDNRGIIYLADQNGSGIVIIGQDGSFQGRQLSFGWKEGLLRYPSQLCISGKGEVFIADRDNSRIQIFNMIE